MKIVKLVSFDSYLFEKGNFRSISTKDEIERENRYLIYQDNILSGSISVEDEEIKKITLKIGTDEKYLLNKTIRILENKASERKNIRFYIYSNTKYVQFLEKMGFIKRKRFFDNSDNKYFQMFKIV